MAIVGEYYGRKNFATIRGFLQLFLVPTTVLGPVFAGLVYDRTGSYQIAFTSFIVALLVGTAFVFLARRPPSRAPSETTEGVAAGHP
jgi:cyanate permease